MQSLQDRVTQGGVLLFTMLTALLLTGPLAAQQSELFEAIDRAKAGVTAVPESEVVRARSRLDTTMDDLAALLERSGEETEWGWKEYLHWEELTEQLQREAPDLKTLRRTYDNLRRKHEGLELRQFLAVRESLIDYINALSFTSQPNQSELFRGLLDQLREAVESAQRDPSAESYSLLGRILGTLESADQAPEVVRLVRKEFGHPNLVARIAGDFITRNTEQAIDDSRPVSEEILGSYQTGTASTSGRVTLHTVPNSTQAELRATLTAETASKNVGRRPVGKLGNVVIYSDSFSKVTATKRILIDDGDLSSCASQARATTCTDIHGVCALS